MPSSTQENPWLSGDRGAPAEAHTVYRPTYLEYPEALHSTDQHAEQPRRALHGQHQALLGALQAAPREMRSCPEAA